MASCLRLASPNASRSWSVFSSLKANVGRRYIHKPRELPYSVEEGLGNFLPPPALATLIEYQNGLLERLNQEIRNDPSAEPHSPVAQRVIDYSIRRERALAFNYAVLALNNSFFLEHLAPPPPEESGNTNHQKHITPELFEKIRTHYGDLLRLKSSFSAAAMGMFTNGWVWMVTDSDGHLGVLHTLGPSTLLIRSRKNMHYLPGLVIGEGELGQSLSDNNIPVRPLPQPPSGSTPPPGVSPSLPTSGVSNLNFNHGPFDPHARSLHASASLPIYEIGTTASIHGPRPKESEINGSNVASIMTVGKVIYPLFCVPVYEHAWMSAGFGVWGKEEWLKEFWSVLNWEKVSTAYQTIRNASLPTV
ncbi:Manganese/iron superoxide dismutase [Gymnopilus junonius]|uniref:Manganese/iron superoxide dismutase n=1 Tax=Gymnopilus junonius TaxID=109634 RepID=A0A9P5NZ13_GYMJU|nr:Manganese/iron superoxide dismutase [Gymnopilus junonius]